MKRKIYDRMLSWKRTDQGKSALIIEGARRVGKSYIVQEFARNEYKSFIFIDFARADREVYELFGRGASQLDLFFNMLSSYYGKRLYPRESVIVLDEVQLCPKARQMVKYLVADGRYDYIETGSLLTLRKNVEDIVIPSEEEALDLYPMDFEEFLWALGDEVSYEFVRDHFSNREPLGQAMHRKMMEFFRQYMLVGGMPQAVAAYVETKNFEQVDRVKKRILHLYRQDISKFAKGYESKVYAIFDGIPAQLSRKDKKYKLSTIRKAARFREYEDAFVWLAEAMVVNPCLNTTDPNVGLSLSTDFATQKVYMADTGLLVTLTFQDDDFISNELYKAILFNRLHVNEGMLMENIVSQELRCHGHRLFFYARADSSHRENNMEIDFLVRRDQKICPVEVKSSAYRKHSSLDKFRAKFSRYLGEPFLLYPKDVMQREGVTHLPLYMAGLL